MLAINAVAVSPSEKHAASVNNAGGLVVYALGGPQPKLVLSMAVADERAGGKQVQGVAFTRDGAGLYTGGGDLMARLTAGPDGMPGYAAGATVRKFEGHAGTVNALALSADGKHLVTGSNDRSVIVWDAATGKLQRVFQGHLREVTCVAVRPDNLQVASASDDGSIRLWPLTAADENRAVEDATDNLWTVAYTPDGRTFATGGADRTVRVYDTATGKLRHELKGHKGAVTALAFLDPNRLASAGGDRTVKIWDVAAGTAKDCTGHTSAVLCLALGGKWLVSGGTDKTVRGWNASDGTRWPGSAPASRAMSTRSAITADAVGSAPAPLP